MKSALLGLVVALLAWPVQAMEVLLNAYHLKPPYIVDADRGVGLYYDLARYLNERISAHQFKMVYLPRRRLESDLELGRLKGLVLGVHPIWFKDETRTRYLWSPAFMQDEDVVVSRTDKTINYDGPDSLVGKRVGLPTGYYYYGVDELVRSGRIIREDAFSEGANLGKLALGRIDAAIVSRPTLEYYLRHQPEWTGRFFVASKPHDRFERYILVPKEYAEVLPDLTAVISAMERDPVWRAQQDVYR